MPTASQWVWIVPLGFLSIAVLFYLLIAVIGTYVVNCLNRVSFQSVNEAETESIYNQASLQVDTAWLADQGFERAGCYRMLSPVGSPGIAGWKHAGGAVFFCVYLFPESVTSDFVSILSDGCGVTTGAKADGLMIPPPPGCWMQVFPDKSINERWDLHLEAEAVIAQATGATPAEACRSLGEEMSDSIARQLGHVHATKLWQLRIPYWFLVRRVRLVNKKVADQMS